MLLFILKSTKNSSIFSENPLPYVKRMYSMAPYWPSRATEKAGFSCYRETTIDSLVSSGQFRDKGPLRVVYLSIV